MAMKIKEYMSILDSIKSTIENYYKTDLQLENNDISDDPIDQIPLAYTTCEDDESVEIQVNLNLEKLQIETYIGSYVNEDFEGCLVHTDKYENIKDLLDKGLYKLRFEDLVLVTEDEIALGKEYLSSISNENEKDTNQTQYKYEPRITVLVAPPGVSPIAMEIDNELHIIQDLVGGYYEEVALTDEAVCWVNEEGKLMNLPFNCPLRDKANNKILDHLVGTIVIAGSNIELEDYSSLNNEQIKYYKDMLTTKGCLYLER